MKPLLFLLLSLVSGISPPGPAADSPTILRRDLDRIFSDQRFADAQWGVEVFSLDRSETLYERSSQRLYIPASNNKILTAAVALTRLGPDYRFKTNVLADGPIIDGVLKGDLIIEGFGDPSSSSRIQPKDPFRAFRSWAASLKQQGIRAIAGNIVGKGASFEETAYGHGWAWDDLTEGFAAPVSALQFNENLIGLEITPSPETGGFASIQMDPLPDYLSLDGRVVTGSAGSPEHIEIERSPSSESAAVRGTLPLKSAAVYRSVAVESPVRYYLSALKHVLEEEGIDASGCKIAEETGAPMRMASLLWVQSSPPLSELLVPLLKMSLNLVSETLTRTLGLEFRGKGTFSKGKEVVEDTLGGMGISKESYAYADGSGLSRLNLVSPDTLVRVLGSMYRHKDFPFFYSALPIAGVDGTLAARMKGTRAENNVRAKTGSLANVSSISGYLRTMDGEMLAFSILANNFLATKDAAEYIQDKALERLASFSRTAHNKQRP
jgi:D-alanyl-D-alanine carboxypeptidase/D-alanyl-D-alanine-endopeptidase (penicillin-binding protein 4)